MDRRDCVQDVIRCTLCETAMAPMYCNVCHIHLCKECIEKHLSDAAQIHNVVPFKQFLSTLNYPKCPNHPTKQCELQCKKCDVPICAGCISSEEHLGHKVVDIFEDFECKKEFLRRDLQELEHTIYLKYQEVASKLSVQRADQCKQSEKLTRDLNQQAKALHQEIDTILRRKLSEIYEMDAQYVTSLKKQGDEINQKLKEIKQVIQDLRSLLETNDVSLVYKYKSRNEEFRILPPKLKVTFRFFQPHEINREKLIEQFGSLSSLSTEKEDQEYSPKSFGTESSPPDRPLLDVPRLITDIATAYKYLRGVSCFSDEKIWIRGREKFLRLYNLLGEVVNSVKTKSGKAPEDIAVMQSGDLVYTDYWDRSINLVKSKKIKKLIRLRGWRPDGVCSTSSGDLLVIMNSNDEKQTKVVRYSGSTKKQSIQWDEQGRSLYTSSGYNKYLTENRNLNVCVADPDARAVVVVNAAGKLRFRYTGRPSDTCIKGPFDPCGITTDSHGHILTADLWNNRIHIVDQDGHFLHYIDCGLRRPWGVCVDSRDNLFVAERDTGKVKKIQYYK